jgi:predicted enzyme related to lactoylglutathione lyase
MAKKKKKKKSNARRKISKVRSRPARRRRPIARKPARRATRPTKPAPTPEQTPKPKPGAFVWHELMTTDPGRAKSFYSDLFGWKTSEMEMMPGFNYTVFSHAKQDHAGMMAITPEHGDVKPHWDVYVSVRDVDATAARCEALGGEIVVPPHDIPVGRWAMLKDPTGAQICVYKSKNR